LVGAWRPIRGKVRLDGASLDQWASEELGKHVGYLPQDIELLPGTVGQNIARFEPEPDSNAVIAAAKAVGAHDLIVSLPAGYETTIDKDGSGLSAGQAQRIALARAVYRNPFLIILDEPNSHLDAEGDDALTRAIAGIRERKGIVIVIAHRPSAIAAVDTILFLNQGRMQAFGPKDEVLSKVLQRPDTAARTLKVVADSSRAGGA
jgi:ATP-binding cassette, subfamily C, type I secretion system permease/ATPase